MNIDPKGAAEAIRSDWTKVAAGLKAEDRHAMNFLEEVCRHLGVEPSPENTSKAAELMGKHGLVMHRADEYPKHPVTKDRLNRTINVMYPPDHPELANQMVTFQNEEEEDAFGSDYDVKDGLAVSKNAPKDVHDKPKPGNPPPAV